MDTSDYDLTDEDDLEVGQLQPNYPFGIVSNSKQFRPLVDYDVVEVTIGQGQMTGSHDEDTMIPLMNT